MAEKSPATAGQVKIGHYILGETLGTGTFGKVKSMSFVYYRHCHKKKVNQCYKYGIQKVKVIDIVHTEFLLKITATLSK